jgi:hypothetical protein
MENQSTLVPLPPDLPTFSAAMVNLNRVPLIAYQALELGASKTASYRDGECPGERLDDGFAASILRFHVNRFLKDKGIDAQLEDDWTLDALPFLGLSFHYAGYHVKILKGAGGVLPGCGTSKRKVAFYGQIPSMYLVGNKPVRSTANLLILWDFDTVYGLSGLWLALPANGGSRAIDVSAFWCERIPRPEEGLLGVPSPIAPPDDNLGDLVVELPEEEKKGNVNER